MALNRESLPSTAALGLTGPHAAADLEWLGWANAESRDLLWTIAGTGDPDMTLNTLRRLMESLGADAVYLDAALRRDEVLRVRLMALAGGSTLLGDHLIANPGIWVELVEPIPEPHEMMAVMLGSVGAEPVDGAEDLSQAGTYRAALSGGEAKLALQLAYRTLIMRIAACDLAGTFAARHGVGAGQPRLEFDLVTRLLTALADAALTAALSVALRTVYGDAEPDARLAVIAMGKCGAIELNYISDVDVIFVAEPATPRANRLAAEFNKLSSACFFEVDPNLRPEGRSGALVRTLDSHHAYYQRWA
ncbi:MAG TPA: bifunctional glutamine-synthetase adenylyltransferase/deadenyltransferase, partial [Corynebacterium sp.]|nr:bifunctional glutamine-synthetase adenylyltransferase/deadenyltransferase [Corynebacterium sp.]